MHMLDDVTEALAGRDPQSRGVVITGGNSLFSAGADFNDLRGDERDLIYDDAVAAVTSAIRTQHCPVLAAIEGPCMGAAVDIALACDARVAGADAFLQVPAARLGILYNPEAVRHWVRDFGSPVIRDLLLLGRRLTVDQAYYLGIINMVVDAGTACDEALKLIPDAAQSEAIAATKAMLADHTTFDPDMWQARRRQLLESSGRAHALAAARGNRSASDTSDNPSAQEP